MTNEREKELQKEVERLRIAYQAAIQRLKRYEAINDMAIVFVSGNVISDPAARPVLVSSQYLGKNTVFAVIPQTTDLAFEQGEKYIFAGECDGQFDTRCKTHHMILRAEHIWPAAVEPGGLPPREQLGMFVITKFVNMFNLTG